jgi:arylsulfatase A-like enzyme
MSRSRYSRREFVTLATALAAVASVSDASGKPRKRPNILWLVSEDNNPFIGAYGDRLAHTPAIDSLAAGGVLYENVFSNAPVCAPTRFSIITGMYAESCGPAHHMRAQGKLPAFLQGFPKYLREAGYYCTNNGKTDYNADLDMQVMWNESSDRAHWRNRPSDAPFFAVFNFMTTHESRMFRRTPGRVKPVDVRVPAYLPDVPEVRSDAASYYNLIEAMDGEVAAHLAALESAGLAEDTIVFYYSDNGGVQPRSKRYCYDEGLRTALIMRVPKKWAHLAPAAAGSKISSPVSLIDLAPTVLTLADIDPPAYMQGRSLVTKPPEPRQYVFGMRNRMDERYDMVRTVRDERYRYIRNYSPHRPYGQHQAFEWQMDSYRALERAYRAGVLNAVQARFFGEKPAEEFYDLQADPDEINNLIGAAEHRARINSMRVALDAHMLRVNDNGFIPESSPVEGYDASRAPGAYPLQRVMLIAAKAIARDTRNVSEFVAVLTDSNEVVRYWAAQGLLMLAAKATGAKGALETCLDKDASHSVRVAAAEALASLGQADRAVEYLGVVIDSQADVRVRLQAVNALTFIGEPAKPLLPLLERVLESEQDEYIRQASRYLILVLRGTYTPESQIYQGRAARVS